MHVRQMSVTSVRATELPIIRLCLGNTLVLHYWLDEGYVISFCPLAGGHKVRRSPYPFPLVRCRKSSVALAIEETVNILYKTSHWYRWLSKCQLYYVSISLQCVIDSMNRMIACITH